MMDLEEIIETLQAYKNSRLIYDRPWHAIEGKTQDAIALGLLHSLSEEHKKDQQ